MNANLTFLNVMKVRDFAISEIIAQSFFDFVKKKALNVEIWNIQ